MAEGSGKKMVNTLFNEVPGENKNCVFYFYLKTEGIFWPTQYFDHCFSSLISGVEKNVTLGHSFWPHNLKFLPIFFKVFFATLFVPSASLPQRNCLFFLVYTAQRALYLASSLI